MIWLSAIGHAIKEHWPKIVIAVLTAFVIAAVAKCEREEMRQDNTLVTTGEQKAVINHQSEVLKNVEKANDAERNTSLDAERGLRETYDYCTRNPADCE